MEDKEFKPGAPRQMFKMGSLEERIGDLLNLNFLVVN